MLNRFEQCSRIANVAVDMLNTIGHMRQFKQIRLCARRERIAGHLRAQALQPEA